MRILTLLADDYDLDRFKKRLALSGYHVIQAKTEQEAWDVLQRDNIQVIVFDCDLAKTDLIERIRRLERSGYVYAFALIAAEVTGNLEENVRTRFVDEYIVKPVEPDELIARLSVVDRYIRTLSALRAKNDPPEPIRDHITGTFTQSTIVELLSAEISRSKRSHKPFALALLALDNIGELENSFDNHTVERALAQVALKIWASVRSYDLIGRWEKSGFILLLPETSLAGASVVADRIRKNVNSVPLRLPDNDHLILSASMGFVQSGQEQATTLNSLIQAAENALARAGQVGGNHIVFAWET